MNLSLPAYVLTIGLLASTLSSCLRADEPFLLPPEDAPGGRVETLPPLNELPPLKELPRTTPPTSTRKGEISVVKEIMPEEAKKDDHQLLKDVTPAELNTPLPPVLEQPEPRHGGFYGSLEYLLLRPRLSNQQYAIVDPTNDITPQGPVRSVTDNLRSGLSVGLGYRFANSGWDVAFNYTALHSNGTDSATAPPGGLIYPELTRPGLTDSALSAIATARLNYNTYDIEFGRLLDVDPATQFRVFSGIRFASIQQDLNAHYYGNLADGAYASTQSNFSGAGPILGGEMRWKVFRALSLFGKAQGGLIYGSTHSFLYETNNGGNTLYTDVTNNYHSMVPMVGFSIGASWQYRGLTFAAGYQAVNYFGLIQRPALVDSFSEGKIVPQNTDLSIDGFFFKLAYAF